jgi:hypothetical protein
MNRTNNKNNYTNTRKSSKCFDFSLFYSIPGVSSDCNNSFLEWFVGMWEGDGSLIKRA